MGFVVWRKVWLRRDVIVNVFFFFFSSNKFKFASGLLAQEKKISRSIRQIFFLFVEDLKAREFIYLVARDDNGK